MDGDPDGIGSRLLLILVLILLNAFFAASEIALVTVRRTRIRQLVEEGSRAARTVQRLIENPTRFMATVQVGVTLVGFLASAIGAVTIAERLVPVLQRTDLAIIANNAVGISVFLITLVIGFVTLVLGEIAPKSIALQHAERIALLVGGIINFISIIALPAVKVVSWTSDLVVRPFGGQVRFSTPIVTEEELKMLVEAGEEEGVIEEDEKEMIHSIFEFTDTIVRQVMVPRIDMKTVEVDSGLNELLDVIIKFGHSRIPVYEDSIDNIVGVVHAKDLLPVLAKEMHEMDIRSVMRPAYFIPETKKIDELMAEFKRSKIQMAIVRDEYGGTAGLVTLEDLLEEIVGDIMDEYDVEERMIDMLDPNHAIVNARMDIGDLNEQMELSIPESEDYETIGGFVFDLFGRQPAEGESVQYENMTFTVKSTEGGRLHKIEIVRIPQPEPVQNGNGHTNGDGPRTGTS
ncbi:MAG TPA: hemolysin family protein, partial [Armatimonadota bacterium]|nr:hemolysin family protein [Armatimonadota bacterium]